VLGGLRLAVGTLTVVPVRVPDADARTAGSAMLWAPAVGAVLGAVAAPVAWGATTVGLGGTVAALAGIATLAALTRGLHLDGLADTADGLGSAAPPDEALRIMKAPDIGAFGVATLVLVVLAQVAALSQLPPGEAMAALVVSTATGRLAIAWACRRGVPAARREGLGALVAETVTPAAATAATAGTLIGAALLSLAIGTEPWRTGLAVLAGLAAAQVMLAHCRRRFGGITGDVLGALTETAVTAALLVLATG
jgi:adenosylcobinamide-GDP ribazoletransferase